MKRLRCPECGVWFNEDDTVYINQNYTLMHERCSIHTMAPIMDKGNYLYIGFKYYDWDVDKELIMDYLH